MKNFLNIKNTKFKKGMTRSIFTRGYPEYSRGMTFIELVVVMSIFTIISSISLFQYKSFQESVDIKSFANDISLKISEAQVNSINGKLIDGIGSPDLWKPSYGLVFNTSLNNKFVYYVNINNTNDYCDTFSCNPPYNLPYHSTFSSEEVIDVYNLNKGFYISDIRAVSQNIETYCSPTGVSITNVDFAFRRPNATTIFYVDPPFTCSSLRYINVVLSSPNGKTSTIRVHATGQIQLIN